MNKWICWEKYGLIFFYFFLRFFTPDLKWQNMAFTEGCRKKNRKKSVKKRFTRRKKSQSTVKKSKNFLRLIIFYKILIYYRNIQI